MEQLTGPSIQTLITKIFTLFVTPTSIVTNIILEAYQEISASYSKSKTSLILTTIKHFILIKIYLFIAKALFNTVHGYFRRKHLFKIAQQKRELSLALFEELYEKIKNSVDHLSKDTKEKLVGASVQQLHHMLFKGDVTSVDLLHFYLLRVIRYGVELKLATEHTYEYSLPMAKERDEELQRKKKSGEWKSVDDLPCLFGVPVSVKDVFDVKGHDTTLGSANHAFDPAKKTGKNI